MLNKRLIETVAPTLRSPLLRVATARIATFPVTVACGLLWLRVVIGNVSTADYALVAVVVGLQFLLSFTDFGTTAHVLEESGKYAADKVVARLGWAVGRAVRTIVLGNLVVFLSAAGIALAGAWGTILGFPDRPSTTSLAVMLTLGINVVARPLSLTNALVAGLGRATVVQWSQATASVVSLGSAAAFVAGNAPLPWIVCTPILGQLVASLIPAIVSMRCAPGLLRASAQAMIRRAGPEINMRRLAGPMLLIQTIGPLNDQLDKIILSHLSTLDAVATYSLAIQFYVSSTTIVTSLLPSLWVQFAELRVSGGFRLVAERAFLYVKRLWAPAIALGIALCLILLVLAPVVSAGKIALPLALCIILGATIPPFVIRNLLGVALTDVAGLRLQALVTVVITAINLALSIGLAASLGALGPALASLIAVSIDCVILVKISRKRLGHTWPPTERTTADAQ